GAGGLPPGPPSGGRPIGRRRIGVRHGIGRRRRSTAHARARMGKSHPGPRALSTGFESKEVDMVAIACPEPARAGALPPVRLLPGCAPSATSAGGSPDPHAAISAGWQAPRVLAMIGRLAVRWSLDNPDVREDLFQEGWLAAWEAELRDPGCPASHLVRSA